MPAKAGSRLATWIPRAGEKFSIACVFSQLLQQGFTKTDFVYEAGQFAIRGG